MKQMISYKIDFDSYPNLNKSYFDISFYLALEKYFINKNDDNDIFFLWDISNSIIIGKNQLLLNEVNVNKALELNCKIYRRTSGGGAIYADDGCFMFSFVTKRMNKDEIYQNYLSKILNVLKKLGLDCYFSGRNDLMYKDKKFSGNAIYFEKDKAILHGTFLYNSNLDNLVYCITPDDNKLISKGIKSVHERVINLKPYLNGLTKEEVMDYLLTNVGDEVRKLELNSESLSYINKEKELFDNNDWIYGKNPQADYKNKKRFSFGNVEIRIKINKNKITSFSLYGDFFVKKDLNEIYEKFIGLDYNKDEMINIINTFQINDYICDMSNNDLIEII